MCIRDRFNLALYVMNELRNTYLAADRGCGAMDKLMLRLSLIHIWIQDAEDAGIE